MTVAVDHLGNELTAEQIVQQVAAMLGWANAPPWHVLERDLAVTLRRLRDLQSLPRVRPGHHPPCPAMLDYEAVCTCGQ